MKKNIKNILAILIVLFTFKAEIKEKIQPIIDQVENSVKVYEVEKPNDEILDLVRSTNMDEREFSNNDKLALAVFFSELSNNYEKVDTTENNQILLDHLTDSFSNYLSEVKLEKQYKDTPEQGQSVSADIKKIWTDQFGEQMAQSTPEQIDNLSKLCDGIAWIILNE